MYQRLVLNVIILLFSAPFNFAFSSDVETCIFTLQHCPVTDILDSPSATKDIVDTAVPPALISALIVPLVNSSIDVC